MEYKHIITAPSYDLLNIVTMSHNQIVSFLISILDLLTILHICF
uniref:Uncharacterized protein n=1 Tax=Arundo donax TaxID=35708 RepID=A0A0A9APW5_ARUDO